MIDGRRRLRKLGGWIHNEIPIRYRLYLHRVFKEAPEKKTSELRFAPVETEGELVEVCLKVIRFYGALMGPEQPPLEETGDAVNSRQGDMGWVAGPSDYMGGVEVVVSNCLRVRRQAVGDNDSAGTHIVVQKRAQGRCSGVGDDAQAATTEPLGAQQLNGHRHKRFALRTTSPLSRLDATDENLVDLNLSGKPLAAWSHHRRPEAVQHGPRGLVRTKTEEPMQGLGRNAILRRGHVPRRREPDHERGAGAVKEGSSSYRYPTLAGLAPEPPVAHPPLTGHPASRTQKTIRPSKPLQVVEARRIVWEPRTQVRIAARIVATGLKTGCGQLCEGRHPNILNLQHSHG